MIFFWIVVIIVVVWWLAKNSNKTVAVSISDKSKEGDSQIRITEETVFKIQNRFEEKLQQTYLPDSLSGKEIYIYLKLMRPWYNQLAGENRYNDEMTQKLRNDWTDYMEALEERATCMFLSSESHGEEKQKSYDEDYATSTRKAYAIEDAFAAAVGKEAVLELKRIHDMDNWDFNRRDGELAPEGFTYGARDELTPKKVKTK